MDDDVGARDYDDVKEGLLDDCWGWTACAWLHLTEKGRALALQLYHAATRKPAGARIGTPRCPIGRYERNIRHRRGLSPARRHRLMTLTGRFVAAVDDGRPQRDALRRRLLAQPSPVASL